MSKAKTVGIWKDHIIRWDFITTVYGGFPAAESVLRPFIQKRIDDGKIKGVNSTIQLTPEGRIELRKEGLSMEELHEAKLAEAMETLPEVEELIEERSLVFQRLAGRLVFWGGNFRSHLKECARTLSSLVLPKKVEGAKSLAVRATNGLYVADAWVHLSRDGETMRKADGIQEFMVHVNHPRTGAPMSSIKHCEYVAPSCSLMFTLKVLGGIVTDQELEMILEYGAVHGFGQERSRGMGRYLFTID